MGKVVTTEAAVHGIHIFASQAATEIQDVADVAAQNAGGLLFGSWSGGAVPSIRSFHALSFYEGLAIGLCALGYGARGIHMSGRLGIYVMPYLGHENRPKLIEWAAQKQGYLNDIANGLALPQNKPRLAGQFTKNGENLGRLLIRVPHR